MRRFAKLFMSIAVGVSLWLPAAPAVAADYCFCAPDIKKLEASGQNTPRCNPIQDAGQCVPQQQGVDANLYQCKELDTQANCEAATAEWTAALKNEQKYNSFEGVAIPSCLFDPVLSEKCRNINTFLIALIKLGKYLFTIIGALALAVFVYGGFLLILSGGSPDKVKKGTDAMLAAVIGLLVAFSGYLLIRFVGEAIGIREIYQLK